MNIEVSAKNQTALLENDSVKNKKSFTGVNNVLHSALRTKFALQMWMMDGTEKLAFACFSCHVIEMQSNFGQRVYDKMQIFS